MNITNIHLSPGAPNLSEVESPSGPAALGDILKRTLSETDRNASIATASIETRLTNPAELGRPESLLDLQTKISDYNIYISLASTLTRKAVSAVETLVKSQ
jgi:hypothetical protein